MKLVSKIDQFHNKIRQNWWLNLFTVFNQILLALGFIPAGITKIIGERFANGLSELHPMGSYLVALHNTGFYYTFIGLAQLLAGILILIPRTMLIGALIYFPIILNIFILSYSVRFDGSFLTSPLMLLSVIYILFWNYNRLKFILPFNSSSLKHNFVKVAKLDKRFPYKVFIAIGSIFTVSVSLALLINTNAIMPRNHIKDCKSQFKDNINPNLGNDFCNCIHFKGNPLDFCLKQYEKQLSAVKK